MKLADVDESLKELAATPACADLKIYNLGANHAGKEWREYFRSDHFDLFQGIYIFATMEEEILYIGKGVYETSGGIYTEACSHLQPFIAQGTTVFPDHRWKNEPWVDDIIKSLIATGDFYIFALAIAPEFFAHVVEAYLLTRCMVVEDRLPRLNWKIG